MEIGRILPGIAIISGRIFVCGGEVDSRILANGEVITYKCLKSCIPPFNTCFYFEITFVNSQHTDKNLDN